MRFVERHAIQQLIEKLGVSAQPREDTRFDLREVADDELLSRSRHDAAAKVRTEHLTLREVLDVESGIAAPAAGVTAEILHAVFVSPCLARRVVLRC